VGRLTALTTTLLAGLLLVLALLTALLASALLAGFCWSPWFCWLGFATARNVSKP
jgi:hypothetical protein